MSIPFPTSVRLLVLILALGISRSSAEDVYPSQAGDVLVLGSNDAAWRPLLAELAAKGTVYAPFTERRHFAFRSVPVILQGEMRLDPERGLSLHYLSPEVSTMIVDAKGVVLRDARGRSRALPNDPSSPSAATALLPVLRFDLVGLDRNFTIRAARAGAAWRFDFTPKNPELKRSLGSIVVEGQGDLVRQLEFRRSATQSVSIEVGDPKSGVVFGSDEAARYFR